MKYIDNITNKKPDDFKQEVLTTLKNKIGGYIDWRKNQITQEIFKK